MKKQCPDDEVFADYIEGRLSDEDTLELEAHLSDCDACIENLVIGKSVARNMEQFELESVPHYITSSAMRLVNDLNTPLTEKTGRLVKNICSKISDYLAPDFWSGQAVSAIRGSDETVSDNCKSVIKNFNGIKTKIEIEKTLADHDYANIRVSLITHSDNKNSTDGMKYLRVSLKKEEREISSCLLNNGYILFEEIPPGEYHLVFIKNDVNIGEYVFTNGDI